MARLSSSGTVGHAFLSAGAVSAGAEWKMGTMGMEGRGGKGIS